MPEFSAAHVYKTPDVKADPGDSFFTAKRSDGNDTSVKSFAIVEDSDAEDQTMEQIKPKNNKQESQRTSSKKRKFRELQASDEQPSQSQSKTPIKRKKENQYKPFKFHA